MGVWGGWGRSFSWPSLLVFLLLLGWTTRATEQQTSPGKAQTLSLSGAQRLGPPSWEGGVCWGGPGLAPSTTSRSG